MKALVVKFYTDIWNRYDKSVIPELLHPDFTFRGSLGMEKIGHKGFSEYLDFIHSALGEYNCEIQEILSEENKVFAKMLFSGIHKNRFFEYEPTQKRLSWEAAALFTFENEKIIQLWVLGDLYGLLKTLKCNASN